MGETERSAKVLGSHGELYCHSLRIVISRDGRMAKHKVSYMGSKDILMEKGQSMPESPVLPEMR